MITLPKGYIDSFCCQFLIVAFKFEHPVMTFFCKFYLKTLSVPSKYCFFVVTNKYMPSLLLLVKILLLCLEGSVLQVACPTP